MNKTWTLLIGVAVMAALGGVLLKRSETQFPSLAAKTSPTPDSPWRTPGSGQDAPRDTSRAVTDPPARGDAIASFATWLGRLKTKTAPPSGGSADGAMVAEGQRLAEARRPIMLRLMRENSERALNRSLRFCEWAALPATIQALVEEPFSERGDLDVIPDCRPLNQRKARWQTHRVAMRGTSFDAFVYGRRSRMTSKLGVPLQGILLGRQVALWESPALPLGAEDLAVALQRFPEGNARGQSWLTGGAAGDDAKAALIGGRVYSFATPEEISQVAQIMTEAEQQLGPLAVQSAWKALTDFTVFDGARFGRVARKGGGLWSDTPKQVLCLRLDFTPSLSTPFTYTELLDSMTTVSNALRVMSYDKTWVTPTVTAQVLVLPNSKEFYDAGPPAPDDLTTVARDLATAAGYGLNSYDIFVYSYPGPWGAFAGGNGMWLISPVGPDVMLHEIGHNYGVGHANHWRGQTGNGLMGHRLNPGETAVEHAEYGDVYDIMGISYGSPYWAERHLNVNLKAALNWLEPQDVATASSNGVYRLHRFDHRNARSQAGEKLALRLCSLDGEEFWVSLREAFVPAPLFNQSACIVWTPSGPASHDLLDATPLSSPNRSYDTGRDDSALAPGQAWTDPSGSFRIQNLAPGGTAPFDYLDLKVTFFTNQPAVQLFTTTHLATPGLVASFVNTSLRGYAAQDDWRLSQTICGSRVDASLRFPTNGWGRRASVGLTGGSDADWDDFSVQWDGWMVVNRAVQLATKSDDSSRMWMDLDNDGVFAASGVEFMNNHWGQGQSTTVGDPSTTIQPGTYRMRIQYEEGGGDNRFGLRVSPVEFEFCTPHAAATPGLEASYVDQSLRAYSVQDDWRASQTIAGSRTETFPGHLGDGWGPRAEVGLTHGSDDNWEQFSAQWDGWLRAYQPMQFATVSDDGSRMWLDVDGDGLFATTAPESVNNHWGSGQGWTFGENSGVVAPGIYRCRAQYEEGDGGDAFFFNGAPGRLSQWIAFNDHVPGGGTHPDVSGYDILGIGSMAGPLTDTVAGFAVPANLVITRSDAGVSAGAVQANPARGTPAHEVFDGYVDFPNGTDPIVELTGTSSWVTFTFTNLNPANRYGFKGTAVRGDPAFTNQWTLCELSGAQSVTSAHSSSRVLTTASVPGLAANHAALCTGVNHTPETGDYVGWENIAPSPEGSFAVTCRLYTGAVPGGASDGGKAYALTAVRLEEYSGPATPVTIVAQPQSAAVVEGQSVALWVTAAGSPLSYQWFKDNEPIPRATGRTWQFAGASTLDTGSYFVVVSNPSGTVRSAVVSVGVYPDSAMAVFRIVPLGWGLSGGGFQGRVTGIGGRGAIVVRASTDLQNWVSVHTNYSRVLAFDFSDVSAASRPARFYEAMEAGRRVPFQGGTASQSSNPWGAGAERAIDGNADGNWSGNSVTHTFNADNEWWEWDLGVPQRIGHIHLWFRTDCCTERNDNLRLTIYDRADPATRQVVWTQDVGANPGSNRAFEVPDVLGQVIRVEHPAGVPEYLSLAEVSVEVWP